MALTKVTGSGADGLNLSSTDVTISSGDLLFATANKGVVLGVTSNTDGNTLADYEEGTWTPTYAQGITSVTYSSQNAKYTKIGNIVHTYCTVNANGGTANSSGIIIGGLPFTTKNDSTYTTATMYVNSASGNGKDTRLITYPNTTHVYLYDQTETGVSQVVGTSVGNGVQLYFSLTYEADGG